MNLWGVAAVVALVAVGIWWLDALLYRLKERPADYEKRGSASGLGNALLRVQALVDPSVASAIEVRESDETDEESSGEPLDP